MAEDLIYAERVGGVLSCPKCNVSLNVVLKEDVEVDCCQKCQGIWVDLIEEKNFFKLKPEVFTVDELRRLRSLYEPLGRIEEVRYFPCPVCKELMYRKNWGSHSGVIVDKCYKHGTFYDREEVEKIKEYIRLGGIEWEKLQIAEVGLKDLSLKLDRQIHRLDMKVDSTYRKARLWSLVGF